RRIEEGRPPTTNTVPQARLGFVLARDALVARPLLRRLLDRGEGLPRRRAPALSRSHRHRFVVRPRDLLPRAARRREDRAGARLLRGLAPIEVQPVARGALQVRAPRAPVVAASVVMARVAAWIALAAVFTVALYAIAAGAFGSPTPLVSEDWAQLVRMRP